MTDLNTTSLKIQKEKTEIVFFACGGTGINIGQEVDFGNVRIINIDSSTSNLVDETTENTFLINDKDGGGKNRRLIYEAFKGQPSKLLTMFKPSNELNFVVHSLTGATGSVVGPMIVEELLRQNKPVIVAVDGRVGSQTTMDNAAKVILGYDAIARKLEKNITMFFTNAELKSESNEEVIRCLDLFTVVTDKQRTKGFDVSDLRSYLNFQTVTSYKKYGVSLLEIRDNEAKEVKDANAQRTELIGATILVSSNPDAVIKGEMPLYDSEAIVTDVGFDKTDDMRIDNIAGAVNAIVDKLQISLRESKEAVESTMIEALDTGDAVQEDDGFFL